MKTLREILSCVQKIERVPGLGECWEWTLAVSSRGYAQVWFCGKTVRVGRLVLRLQGTDMDGLFALHRCDNPRCVNPEHLFAGTLSDNTNDAVKKGRHVNNQGDRHGMSQLTAQQVIEIREAVAAGETQQKVGDRFGICNQQVSMIVRRLAWKHV